MLGKIGANEEATKMQMRSKRNTGKEIQTKGKYQVHVAIDKNKLEETLSEHQIREGGKEGCTQGEQELKREK